MNMFESLLILYTQKLEPNFAISLSKLTNLKVLYIEQKFSYKPHEHHN